MDDQAHLLPKLWSIQGCIQHSASQTKCSMRLQNDVVRKLQNKRMVKCMVLQLRCEVALLSNPLRGSGGTCNALEKASEGPAAKFRSSICR